MMNKYSYRMSWSDKDNGYIIICPEFPGLSAFGETEEEALREAKVALELFIEDMQESGETLPKPQVTPEYSGQLRLRLPKSLHLAAAQMAEKDNCSLNKFLVDAIRSRVTGEQVGGRLLEELKREMSANRMTIASIAMAAEQPMTRYTEKTSKEITTELTYFVVTGSENRKGN